MSLTFDTQSKVLELPFQGDLLFSTGLKDSSHMKQDRSSDPARQPGEAHPPVGDTLTGRCLSDIGQFNHLLEGRSISNVAKDPGHIDSPVAIIKMFYIGYSTN